MSSPAESINPDANGLFVAGIYDEDSLGWSAAREWLDADPDHYVFATVRSDSAAEFIDAQTETRNIQWASLDWTDADAIAALERELSEDYGEERNFAGVVHSIASASPKTFQRPAHELDPDDLLMAANASAVSFLRTVQLTKVRLASNGGYVTFGFGEPGRVTEGYGAAMGMAKASLTHLVAELGNSLGQEDPSARTAEIVPGLIRSHSGRGVMMANRMAKPRDQRPKEQDIVDAFEAATPLEGADSSSQLRAAGKMAVMFVINPAFETTTGVRIPVDGGWSNRSQSMM